MLRSSLRTARLLNGRSAVAAAGRPWSVAASRQACPAMGIRCFADQKHTEPLTTPRTPVDAAQSSETATADSQESFTPPKKKGFLKRLRNLFVALVLLEAAGFVGGVWYSRINDSFHDFFTEYVPFGEQAVLYLEELEFKKRFPEAPSSVSGPRERGETVRIPVQSGASWRVADQTEPAGRRSSAASSSKEVEVPPKKVEASTPAPAPASSPPTAVAPVIVAATEKPKAPPPAKLRSIDLMSLQDAKEPIVRDLVHMLNDLILVINADNAHGKYGSSVEKAKDEVVRMGGRLRDLKTAIERQAADEVRSTVAEFDAAASDLIQRVESTMAQQEQSWRQEFEDEMAAVRESYDRRVEVLLEREQALGEARLESRLLEQAVALKRQFTREVEARVEEERESRMGRLEELSAAVTELERLSLGWDSVVEQSLKTQQLHVAVEGVRAGLEDGQHPRPFIRELVAIKEIAADDALVDAAIGSITPAAYQRGISTPAQLIDRFRRVAGEVRKASLLPDDAGVASHASSWVLSHVMFKKQGLAEGEDVESILTRSQTYLEEGDLDAAAREMTGLQGWAKTLSRDWLAEARKVLEVQQALDVISTEARLRSLRIE